MNWRSWATEPPQIAWAPIEIEWEGDFGARNHCILTPLDLIRSGLPTSPRFIRYRPLGIYREEFHSITGRWL